MVGTGRRCQFEISPDACRVGLRTPPRIGAELYLAEKTVKNYVSSLLHKLGFTRRTEAAVYAAERRRTERP